MKVRKKLRVGILTLCGNFNYGNRLQNYAVTKIISSLDINCNNLIFEKENNSLKAFIKRITSNKLMKYIRLIQMHKDYLKYGRIRIFEEFTYKYMKNKVVEKNNVNFLKKYDYFIVGSDQVWNPDFAGDSYYFLDFAEQNKRIAFSASIGYEKLLPETMKQYAGYWRQMQYISVREDSAADIIEQTIGKRPDVFLDPTLLLDRNEWDKIVKKPKTNIPDKYILCLFLGKILENISGMYREQYNIPSVILNDKSFPDYYMQGPSEFLWLVQNAELILTDSFHCAVFSIIYHRQFIVFKREDIKFKNMFTRLESLLSKLGFQDRVQDRNNQIIQKVIEEERFVNADRIMQTERIRVTEKMREVFHLDE